jgi:transposase
LDSFSYKRLKGRPARLTKSQKQGTFQYIVAGLEACVYRTGCWISVLIQDMINKKYKVFYNRFYVCELLRNLGLFRQKARFISSYLDEDALATLGQHADEIKRLMSVYTKILASY